MKLEGKVAIVTGAGSGIGRAVARRFAQEGARLVLNDITEEALGEVGNGLPEACLVAGDVADPGTADRTVAAAVERFGRIDILVNNAGITRSCPAEDLPSDGWERIVAVNLSGQFYMAQAVGRRMIERRSGCIVNVASMAGLHGIPENVAYVASKHGVVGLTKALVVEWARYGIRVNCVCPGLTSTPLVEALEEQAPAVFRERKKRIPGGRLATPEEQAAVITFLASDEASYVSGLVANVDAGSHALYSGYALPHVEGGR
ncbi:MAG TPA: SDR family oxidoreductase [Firmicutes bacterium]|nr:SDR family oxidoreductase [Bacillota bacterium]